jgi:hypothetical protein
MMRKPSPASAQKRDNSQRIAAEQMNMLFFATPPESRYSKRKGPVDSSFLTIERKTYADSKVRSATKPGTG